MKTRTSTKTLSVLGLVVGLLAGQANATLIYYTLSDVTGLPSGSFGFDADAAPGTMYSDVAINGTFGDFYNSVTLGTPNGFSSIGGFGDLLSVNFLSPLTNAGGTVAYSGTETLLPGTLREFVKDLSGTVSVSEPGSLGLLGLGLLGVAFARRANRVASRRLIKGRGKLQPS